MVRMTRGDTTARIAAYHAIHRPPSHWSDPDRLFRRLALGVVLVLAAVIWTSWLARCTGSHPVVAAAV